MPDAHEASRKQVQQESAQELIERERHQPLFVVMGGVAPAKGDLLTGKRDKSMVGDSNAMGVTAKIAKRVLRASEGSF